jgi:hypothetical protein
MGSKQSPRRWTTQGDPAKKLIDSELRCPREKSRLVVRKARYHDACQTRRERKLTTNENGGKTGAR